MCTWIGQTKKYENDRTAENAQCNKNADSLQRTPRIKEQNEDTDGSQTSMRIMEQHRMQSQHRQLIKNSDNYNYHQQNNRDYNVLNFM